MTAEKLIEVGTNAAIKYLWERFTSPVSKEDFQTRFGSILVAVAAMIETALGSPCCRAPVAVGLQDIGGVDVPTKYCTACRRAQS